MKIDVTQLQHLMDRSNLGKDNTHTKTCFPIIFDHE